MTEKQKREYIILTILVVGIVAVVYFYFFGGSGANNNQLVSLSNLTTTGTLPDESRSAYLPYGPNLNLDVFNTPGYSQLVSPSFPTVSPNEIGESNPFTVIK